MSPLIRQLLVSCALLSVTLPQRASALPSLLLPPDYTLELREIAVKDVQRRVGEDFMTQFINVRQELVTLTNKVTVTSTQFQTCTAVTPGTPPCPTIQAAVTDRISATASPEATQSKQDDSTITSVPVLLPSCNCPRDDEGDNDLPKLLGDGYRLFTRRTPRLLAQEPEPMIVLTRTTTLVDTVTETVRDTATIVGLTYGGCVPTDAVTTTACAGA